MSMSPSIPPVPYSNPLAQPWLLPSFEAPRVNLRTTYGGTFTVPAGTTVYNQAIPIHSNADFLCREFAFDIADADPGDITVRMKDSRGRRASRDMLAVEELEGPLQVTWKMERTTQILVDLTNNNAADIDVQVILKGIEVFQPLGINNCMPGFEEEEYVPLYERYSLPAPGWHDEPYDMYFELDATASQVRGGVPLSMDTDADFFWRGISGYSNEEDGIGLLKLKFKDAFGNQLSSDDVLQANEVGVAPNARPMFPECVCPAYSTLTVDATEYTGHATTLRFVLRGVKRYRDE